MVTVTFTEPVSLSGGSTEVFDDTGATVSTQGDVSGATVTIDLPDDLDDGSYVVAWRVISADSHPISGSTVFSVGAPSTGGPVDVDVGSEVPAPVSAWRVGAMAVTYAGVLAAVGLWWLARRWYRLADVVEGDGDGDDDRRRCRRRRDGDDDGIFGGLARLDRWQRRGRGHGDRRSADRPSRPVDHGRRRVGRAHRRDVPRRHADGPDRPSDRGDRHRCGWARRRSAVTRRCVDRRGRPCGLAHRARRVRVRRPHRARRIPRG